MPEWIEIYARALLNEVRKRIESVKDEMYRNALMYQYLIGGNASEISAHYT